VLKNLKSKVKVQFLKVLRGRKLVKILRKAKMKSRSSISKRWDLEMELGL